MNRSVTIYLLIFIISAFTSINGQESSYDFKYFTSEDGMSSQFITSIIQDEKGFVWIGTTFGLNRFDGRNFESFTKANSNLKKDRIVDLFEDVDGNIWTIFFKYNQTRKNSISIFDPLLKKAKDFTEVFPELPFSEKEIINSSLYNDGKDIWFNTENGIVYKYDGKFNLIAKDKDYQKSKIKNQKLELLMMNVG